MTTPDDRFPIDSSRRRSLAQLSALGLAAASPFALREALAAGKLTIGFIYVGPKDDFGYNQAHAQAAAEVKKLGFKIIEEENVPETVAVQKTMTGMIVQDGATLLFPTSYGYFDPHILALAGKYPDVRFSHCGGLWTEGKHPKNVGSFFGYIDEAQYLNGVVAGHTTKSKKIAFIAAKPIPQVLRNINAFTLGARSVNPKARTKVIWINSWYNPAREREAAEALAGQGCDVFYQNTDSPAIVQMAEAKGLHAFGQDSDMTRFGPKAHLSANTVNWGVYYVAKVRQALEGKWRPEDTKWGMKEGMIELATLNPAISADTVKLFEAKKAAIAGGSFHPFSGLVKDQAGATKVAAGQTISEAELWGMKWYVEGVEGKLPG